MQAVICVLSVILCLFVIVTGIGSWVLNSERKKNSKLEEKLIQAEADAEWEKTKANIKKEVSNENKKNKEKLNSGTKSERINAAGNILRNNKNSSNTGNS